MRLLITGAAGYVGRHVTRGLESSFDLRLADVQPVAGDSRFVAADVTSLQDMLRVTEGMDAVLHLAVASGVEGEVEDDAFNQRRFDVNVKGTFAVLEAARRCGARRVVHTSSIMVTWGYPKGERMAGAAAARTRGTYSLTKHLAEMTCEHFARTHGLSIVCLRIPRPIDVHDPRWRGRRLRPQWLPFDDLIRAFRLALTVPNIGFEVATVVGVHPRCPWDLSRAREVLGYEPTIRLEEMGFDIGDVDEVL